MRPQVETQDALVSVRHVALIDVGHGRCDAIGN